MKRRIGYGLIIMLITLMICGCNKDKDSEGVDKSPEDVSDSSFINVGEDTPLEKIKITIGALKGAQAIGIAQIMKNNQNDTARNIYTFSITESEEDLSEGLKSGEINAAVIPCDMAAKLYNETNGNVVVAAINTLGSMYVAEIGDKVKSVKDLKGKTVYITGKHTTKQYVFEHLIENNGINPDNDITLVYKSSVSDVLDILKEDKAAIAVLSEPYMTQAQMANDKVRSAINIDEEWSKIEDESNLITGVLAANKEFVDNNTPSFDAFLAEYGESVEYANANIEDTAGILGDFDVMNADVAVKAIPQCNIAYFDGDAMKEKVENFVKILFSLKSDTIGGTLPEENFYYIKNVG